MGERYDRLVRDMAMLDQVEAEMDEEFCLDDMVGIIAKLSKVTSALDKTDVCGVPAPVLRALCVHAMRGLEPKIRAAVAELEEEDGP